MTNHNAARRRETLSESQRKFIDAVDRLATIPEGPAIDILRHGVCPAFPGVRLVSYIVATPKEYSEPTISYVFQACVVPEELAGSLEAIWVDTDTKQTIYQVGDGIEPFDIVPDEVIDSFLERYHLLE